MATGRAVKRGAWFEEALGDGVDGPCSCMGRLKREPVQTPKPCQREQEADHEQENEHMKGHIDPRCLKWGARRASVSSKDKASLPSCQAIESEIRIVDHRESLYHTIWAYQYFRKRIL
jgi:hypothetical protein